MSKRNTKAEQTTQPQPTVIGEALASAIATDQKMGAAPLATPAPASSLQPDTVPKAPVLEGVVVNNEFTQAAGVCVQAVLAASRARYDAWQAYADKVGNMDKLPLAALALQTEFAVVGYKRGQVEVSEWKTFAAVYLASKGEAMELTDYNRKVPDQSGIKGADGKVKLVRPSTEEVIGDLRAVRNRLITEGKIPEGLFTVKPPRGNGQDKGNHVTDKQYDAIIERVNMMDFKQTYAQFCAIVTKFGAGMNFGEVSATMIHHIHEQQVKAGFPMTAPAIDKVARQLIPGAPHPAPTAD